MTIRKATVEDISQIIQIIKKLHIKNLDDIRGGFLTASDVSTRHTLDLLKKYRYSYVALVKGLIAGFVIAGHFSSRTVNEADFNYLTKLFCNKTIIYILRVGVLPEYRQEGIGR